MFDAQEMRAPALPSDTTPAPPLPQTTLDQSTHLLDRLTAVFKHRRIAGTAFLLVVSAMMLQSYSTIPQYATEARLEIQNPRSVQMTAAASQDQYFEDPDIYYATQVQILQSRDLARRVVRRLNLQTHPDFNGMKPRPRDPVSLIREARAAASRWVRSLVTRQGPGAATLPAPDESAIESGLIRAFLPGLSVHQQRLTSIFEIRYEHTDPDFGVVAANAIAEEYIAQNLEVRLGDTNKRLNFVNSEVERSQNAVRDAEEAMTRYRDENNALSLQDRTNLVESSLSDAQTAVTRAEANRKTREVIYNQLRNVNPADASADAHPSIGSDRDVAAARAQLAQLETRRSELASKGLGERHQLMEQVSRELAIARELLVAERRKVIEQARTAFEQARAEEQSFAGALAAAKAGSMDLSRKAGEYTILQDRANNERSKLKGLLEEKSKLEVIASSRVNNARMVDRAEPRRTPISPNSRRDLMFALMAGLAIAFGLAFGIEYLDDTVKTPEDITKYLKLPLLGLVPAVKGDHVPILTETVPHDFGEAFRSLRTSLVFTSGGESTRVIAVTSSQPLEGKTTTAANLSLALALGGARVMLIDADMRRPGLHKTMGLQNAIGLSHVLTGQARVKQAVQRTPEPNLFVMTAGHTPPNPSELLSSERMNQLVAVLGQGPFDWVVIDTPPVLAVTDAVIVAQKVAGVVFVVGSEMTRRVHAERALATLQAGRARGIGAVLNRIDFDRNKYYYSRYYGYQYKNYYGQSSVA
jgi:capsular exopolysaccharide synthesis family protein